MQQHISKGRMTSPPYYNLVSENGSLLPRCQYCQQAFSTEQLGVLKHVIKYCLKLLYSN